MINRYLYLKRGKEYYLVLETEKSRERAPTEILMIDEVVSAYLDAEAWLVRPVRPVRQVAQVRPCPRLSADSRQSSSRAGDRISSAMNGAAGAGKRHGGC